MASKIFMGDMPELMENILNNLNNESYSLYSCSLVSRYWCKMSISILWRDPFSFGKFTKKLFISKYFSSLGEDEKHSLKECLKEYGINVEISNTLFDYARFLKVLHLYRLERTVQMWIDVKLANSECDCNDDKLMNFIINLLFKLFIESGATLQELDLYFSDFLEIKPEIFYSLKQNEQFFTRLQDLSLGVISGLTIESTTRLLITLAKKATKISALEFFRYYYHNDESQLFHALVCFIKSQVQLRQFSLSCEEYPTELHGIISALECQKNSLQEIIIENCAFSTEFKILKSFKKLEILRIRHCDHPKLLKILNYEINTLEIVDFDFDVPTIVQFLEKSGILLQRLKLEADDIFEESILLNAIKSLCPNITYLSISNILISTQLLELIGNLQKLKFLTLWCSIDGNMPEEELNIRIIQFAKTLPLTLQYLDLRDGWLDSYIDILLNYCNAPLNKLIIYRLENEENIEALIEFCIQNGTLNYVGVKRYMNLDNNVKKEVEKYVTLVPDERIIVNC